MWMVSVMSGSRIFAIDTTPKSENPKLVSAISFAKSIVTTKMGTMQIERRKRAGAQRRPSAR
jgi:hypothetical protein